MKRYILAILTILILFSSCSPQQEQHNGTATLTVVVEDSIASSKAVVPVDDDDPLANTDITHYVITLTPAKDGTQQKEIISAYIPRNSAKFVARGIESGTFWKATVEAYVDITGTHAAETANNEDNKNDFTRVAIAESEEVQVTGNNTVIPVSLTQLERTDTNKAGTATVRLLLPEGIGRDKGDSSTFSYEYWIYKDGDVNTEPASGPYHGEVSSAEVAESGSSDESGLYYFDFTVDGLDQGKHLIVVTVTVPSENIDSTVPHITRTSAEAMTLLPSHPAYGEIDLRTTEALSPEFIITDKLGETLTVAMSLLHGSQGSDGVYQYVHGTEAVTATFSDLPDNAKISFFLDGESVIPVLIYGEYLFRGLSSGLHTLSAAVVLEGDNAEPLSAGFAAVQFYIDFDDIDFVPKTEGGSV